MEQGGSLNEAAAFLWMICYGLASGFLFDLMAFLRRLVHPGGFSSFFLDLMYCLAIGAGFLLFLYAGWQGVMRVYWVLGAVAGFGIYHIGPGRAIRKALMRWAGRIRHGAGRAARRAEQKMKALAKIGREKIEAYKERRMQNRMQKRETEGE